MSRLSQLLQKARTQDPHLAEEIAREVRHLQQRRSFGLNFERHTPESVELPGRKVRKGDKVRVLPPRGDSPTSENDLLWSVTGLDRDTGTARLAPLDHEADPTTALLDDLVVTAEFTDPIYPGLVSTGKVERGGDKPFHTVINAENYHALETLLFTHQGKVDAIYIDPPYNTGAKDWKYNNDYVDNDDVYRHSKWLAFMERRLKLAKELLNPDDSVLIVTIDEKEYLRLGLLLEQILPQARIQMLSVNINVRAVARSGEFGRVNEYIFVLQLGSSSPKSQPLDGEWLAQGADAKTVRGRMHWTSLSRTDATGYRRNSPGGFYPFYVNIDGKGIHSVGEVLPLSAQVADAPPAPEGTVAVWPRRSDGSEGRWQTSNMNSRALISEGFMRSGPVKNGKATIYYVKRGERQKVQTGEYVVTGRNFDGSIVTEPATSGPGRFVPPNVWNIARHDAGVHGSRLVQSMLVGRKFPFPKALYAVEDTLRFFLDDKPNARILDFFSGSGTTAHAVMRLNKQDGGRRQSISVTNNEVSADEQKQLRADGHRPGDPEWEALGICDYITKPRITAAITGKTPDGEAIKGDYKFTDEFPMSDGFAENAEYFTLTYEAPSRVARNRDFSRIAPLLWLAAGAEGRRIEDVTGGWDVSETYGVLTSLDHTQEFVDAMNAAETTRYAFVVTDDERSYQRIASALPHRIEAVRLYEQYLKNFEILVARSAR